MSIKLNDNIKVYAGKPLDARYLNNNNQTYFSTTAANLSIPISERYIGLTLNIGNIEYWYKDGVSDSDLVKKFIDANDYITGATNVGYFSGRTGVQTLPIDFTLAGTDSYDGNYNSLYNYYYRGIDGKIHVGTPSDGIPKRGYVKNSGLVKSWIWNEYTGGTDAVGWILIDGDISKQLGTFQYGSVPSYYDVYGSPVKLPYTNTSWSNGIPYNNGSWLVVNAVKGSLTTGNTLTIGGRPYDYKIDKDLYFRTVISETPSTINVRDDETFIYVSGKTLSVNGSNLGTTGARVYANTSGSTLNFRRLVGSGDTNVVESGDRVIIYSSGTTAPENRYDLSSPSTVTVGGLISGSTLTGNTAFELFEKILVPTLYPTLTNPSASIAMSPSGMTEIGTVIPTISVTGNFNQGCINPQYSAVCDKRSNGALSYCFTGAQTTYCCVDTSNSRTEYVTSYSVLPGVQTWSVKVNYKAGVQPFDSKGNNYCTPLPLGTTPTASASITGILPWYWGLSDSMSVNGNCVAICGRDGLGCKCVDNVTSSPLGITFNSTACDYIWFALPACASDKTCWYVNTGNSGCIGDVGNLFTSGCTISVSSFEGCWSNCNYKLYVSCYRTGTAANTPMYIS